MREAWGAERPVISAEDAERWAAETGLRFPVLVADKAPEWVWHDGGEDRYVGYLPGDWDAGVKDCSYQMLELRAGDDQYGIYEWFFDLGVCTVVVRGDRNGSWQDEPSAIAALTIDLVGEWQQADGWFDEQLDEFDEYFEPVFAGFDEFERDMRSEDLGFEDGSAGLVAISQGWAERRGPYSEWVLAVRQLETGAFIGLSGPLLEIPSWRFRREFVSLEDAMTWIRSAAESIGTTVELSTDWL